MKATHSFVPTIKNCVSALHHLPLFKKIRICNRIYFISHTVPQKAKMLDWVHCRIPDFTMGEPEYEKTYFDDKIMVTGHTPTELIDKNYTGRIWHRNNHIAMDCRAVFGNPLGCICLETGEKFYTE